MFHDNVHTFMCVCERYIYIYNRRRGLLAVWEELRKENTSFFESYDIHADALSSEHHSMISSTSGQYAFTITTHFLINILKLHR